MIPKLKDIIEASGIHPSRVFNVTIFGSRIYGTFNINSDWDIIMVANNSVDSIEVKTELYNIHIYTPDKFKEDLDWHKINNLECVYAPKWAILKEEIIFDFIYDYKKMRHSISHLSSNSWVKSRKKIEFGEYYIGLKSIFHAIRIPMFGKQIAENGCIFDFSCANNIWDELCNNNWSWDELNLKYKSIHNMRLSEFRKANNLYK